MQGVNGGERRSNGQCLFIMAEQARDEKDVRAQLVDNNEAGGRA